MYESLKRREKEGTLSDFGKNLLKDWGNKDIFGPWTEDSELKPDKPGTFKFFKSYYLIDDFSKEAKIDTL